MNKREKLLIERIRRLKANRTLMRTVIKKQRARINEQKESSSLYQKAYAELSATLEKRLSKALKVTRETIPCQWGDSVPLALVELATSTIEKQRNEIDKLLKEKEYSEPLVKQGAAK